MKYLNRKKMAYLPVMAAMFLGLAACSSSGDSGTAATGGGSTACTDVSGEPDILGQISFNPSSGSAGSLAVLSLPVDAETQYVLVALQDSTLPIGSGFIGGVSNPQVYAVASPASQTLSIPLDILSTAAMTDYRAIITLCTVDPDQCNSPNSSTIAGVATVYSDLGFGAFTRISPSGSVQSNSCVNSVTFGVR